MEILVAIVLVGILASVAVVVVSNLTGQGRAAACTASADAARAGATAHLTATGREPTTLQDMVDSATLELPEGTTLDPSQRVLLADQWQMVMNPGPPASFVCGTSSPALRTGAESVWQFEEPSGATAQDSGPNRQHGTWNVGAARPTVGVVAGTSAGRFGEGRWLANTNVPAGAPLDLTAAITVEAWINPSQANVYGGIVEKGIAGNHNRQYSMFVWGGTVYWRLRGANDALVDRTANVQPNRWSHIVGTYDGTTSRLYVNGALVSSAVLAGPLASGNGQLFIGSFPHGNLPVYTFSGSIDDVSIYGTVLSASQITSRWTARNDLAQYRQLVTTDQPISSWRFEETAATLADDSGASGTDLTWRGGEARATAGFAAGSNAADLGSSATVEVASPGGTSLDLTTALTLEAWVNPANRTHYGGIVERNRSGFVNSQYTLYFWNGTLGLRLIVDGVLIDTTWMGLQPNRWTHLAATWDGTTARIYADGVQVASRAVTGALTGGTGVVAIGAYGVNRFHGSIDEVAIYDRALTPAEIQANAAMPRA